jgi:hypothetical protein
MEAHKKAAQRTWRRTDRGQFSLSEAAQFDQSRFCAPFSPPPQPDAFAATSSASMN